MLRTACPGNIRHLFALLIATLRRLIGLSVRGLLLVNFGLGVFFFARPDSAKQNAPDSSEVVGRMLISPPPSAAQRQSRQVFGRAKNRRVELVQW